MSRRTSLLAAIAGLSLVAACTATAAPDDELGTPPAPEAPEQPEQPEIRTAELRVPADPVTVLAADDPLGAAVAVSSTLFAEAPVALVAPAEDVSAQLAAASYAVALAAPLLVAAPSDAATPGPNAAVADELGRLGAIAVVTVGSVDPAALPPDAEVVEAPGDLAELEGLLDRTLSEELVAEGQELTAVLTLDRATPTVLRRQTPPAEPAAPGTPSPTPTDEDDAPLPRTEPAEAPEGALLLVAGTPADLAPVATARAAGWDVAVVPSGDPRSTPETVQAVAEAAPQRTVAVGTVFGAAEALTWKVGTAATGVELPGGGQVLFPRRRMVALYGTPGTGALGLLGEQGLAESIARAQAFAAEYQALTTDPVVPAFEMIVTIASAGAGDDGQYSRTLPVESFVPWIEAARDAGIYVVLDLQPGRTDFLTQARMYEPLLTYPNVGLALDPEWRLKPDQVHLRQIGSVGIDEVNAVVSYLADLTRDHTLPQKLLVLHQFKLSMIDGRERLDTSREELALMIHADGQGSQPAKQDTWRALHAHAPAVWWGWKNFVDEDVPMLTPAETYGQVEPVPHLVTYQ